MLRRAAALALALLVCVPSIAAAAVDDAPFGPSPAERVGALAVVPGGFEDTLAISNLTAPTSVRFAADGTVFVAEKTGTVKRYDSLADPTPDTVVDVRAVTHDFWDRGLLGLAVDPAYPARPYVYVSYSYDDDGGWQDACPSPPGATANGCVIGGRVARVNVNTGAELVLVEDFCQQFPSHSVGGLAFGADGALYASAGEGANFNYADERPTAAQPYNPCGDPPREGGSIRSQDLRTAGDPLGLDGALLRLDPDVPLSAAERAQRVIGMGLRNPFRIAVRPGTSEVWLGDVGWGSWEEIDRRTGAGVANFGWPCYEGAGRLASWDQLDNPVCEGLYAAGAGAHTTPYFAYRHAAKVADETCPTTSSSISGLAFYDGGTFPPEYDGALFFADYARRCVWAMLAGADGLPDPDTVRPFLTDAPAVDLQVGPGGDLFYADFDNGAIRRVRATNGNRAPVAHALATPDRGPLPLVVAFDGSSSTDPDGTPLTYSWDFDGNGTWDGTGATVTHTFTTSGTYRVRLRVRDPSGLDGIDEVTVYAGAPPTAAIATPVAGTTWQVGDTIAFSGSGTSSTGTPLPASALNWTLRLYHCPHGGCHVHAIQTWTGSSSGSLVTPDHEYPSYLELVLTATDDGLSTTVTRRLDPRTVRLTVATDPPGLTASLGSESGPAPLTADVIVGSTTSFGVATPQLGAGRTWAFTGWPEPGPPVRQVVAGTSDATYTARFSDAGPAPTPTPTPTPTPGGDDDDVVRTRRLDGSDLRLYGARRAGRGPHGAMLAFDGAGDTAVAGLAGRRLGAGFTVSAWVKLSRARRGPVAVGERRGSTAFALGVRPGRTRWRGPLAVDAGVRPGRWTRVALSWDGKIARLYVDGRPAGRRAAGVRLGKVLRIRLGGDPRAGAWLRGRLARVELADGAVRP